MYLYAKTNLYWDQKLRVLPTKILQEFCFKKINTCVPPKEYHLNFFTCFEVIFLFDFYCYK